MSFTLALVATALVFLGVCPPFLAIAIRLAEIHHRAISAFYGVYRTEYRADVQRRAT